MKKKKKRADKKAEEDEEKNSAEKEAREMFERAEAIKNASKLKRGKSIFDYIGLAYRLTKAFILQVPPEREKTAGEKYEEQKAAATEAKAREAAMNEAVMEAMFDLRDMQRAAENMLNDRIEWWTGVAMAKKITWELDDLFNVCRIGNYNTVMDILEDSDITPNDTNVEGISPFLMVLNMILNNEAAENSDQDVDQDFTMWQRMKTFMYRYFRKKVVGAKLDMVLKILLYKKGNVNFIKQEKDGDGFAALHNAATLGSVGFITWLISKNANPTLCSLYGKTPLMCAAAGDKIDAVMLLLKKGAMMSINVQDRKGMSALHYAARFASPELATVLLICGANISLRSHADLLPVEEAQSLSRNSMVEILRTATKTTLDFKRRMEFYRSVYTPTIPEEDEGAGNSKIQMLKPLVTT